MAARQLRIRPPTRDALAPFVANRIKTPINPTSARLSLDIVFAKTRNPIPDSRARQDRLESRRRFAIMKTQSDRNRDHPMTETPHIQSKGTVPWIVAGLFAATLVVVAVVFSGKVHDLNTTVGSLQARLNQAKAQIDQMQEQLTQAKEGSAQLQGQLDQAKVNSSQLQPSWNEPRPIPHRRKRTGRPSWTRRRRPPPRFRHSWTRPTRAWPIPDAVGPDNERLIRAADPAGPGGTDLVPVAGAIGPVEPGSGRLADPAGGRPKRDHATATAALAVSFPELAPAWCHRLGESTERSCLAGSGRSYDLKAVCPPLPFQRRFRLREAQSSGPASGSGLGLARACRWTLSRGRGDRGLQPDLFRPAAFRRRPRDREQPVDPALEHRVLAPDRHDRGRPAGPESLPGAQLCHQRDGGLGLPCPQPGDSCPGRADAVRNRPADALPAGGPGGRPPLSRPRFCGPCIPCRPNR